MAIQFAFLYYNHNWLLQFSVSFTNYCLKKCAKFASVFYRLYIVDKGVNFKLYLTYSDQVSYMVLLRGYEQFDRFQRHYKFNQIWGPRTRKNLFLIKFYPKKQYFEIIHIKTYYVIIRRKSDKKFIDALYLFDTKFIDVNKYREVFAALLGVDPKKLLIELKQRKHETIVNVNYTKLKEEFYKNKR
jgi:hypothetical protein